MDSLLILRLSATAALPAFFTASRLSTGSAPGRPRHTGQVLLFGSCPNSVEQAQKIFESVLSCAWTSRPMTASQPSFTASLLTVDDFNGHLTRNYSTCVCLSAWPASR